MVYVIECVRCGVDVVILVDDTTGDLLSLPRRDFEQITKEQSMPADVAGMQTVMDFENHCSHTSHELH